ncbi:MAG: aldo/keto reductase [Nostoc sp.]|uniref:aldo/keto reductase n=1 Tax=Nostoc sp. TaxID=1180 RepID=UPI002FFA55F7
MGSQISSPSSHSPHTSHTLYTPGKWQKKGISDFADITAETLTFLTVTAEYQVIYIKNLSLPDCFSPSTVRSSEFCSYAKLAISTKAAATKQIDESLKRLQTDHIDLLQHHEVIRMEDPDRIFAPGGAMEAVVEAQKAGKIRYIGFTGHKDPLVHLRMLEVANQNKFRFDAVQMPLNVMDAHFRSFERQVLPKLVQDGIAVLGMKSMGDQNILKSNVVKPIECLHYAMNLPTSTVITGIESMPILNQAFEAVRTFTPMSQEQVKALLNRTRQAALKGQYELFKTTSQFDGTAKNPEWLG